MTLRHSTPPSDGIGLWVAILLGLGVVFVAARMLMGGGL